MMLQKIRNSRFTKLQDNSEVENPQKKNDVKDLLSLLSKKTSSSNTELTVETANTNPSTRKILAHQCLLLAYLNFSPSCSFIKYKYSK